MKTQHRILFIACGLLAAALAVGTWRNPEFWQSAEHRGDRLMAKHRYADAAKAYQDPWRIGVAQYRDSQFENAAKTFARVPGAEGAFNAANAWLMHGQYERAIAGYDKALGMRPGWKDALDNKQLAIARRDLLNASGKDRDQESAEAYKPDEVVMDQKGEDQAGEKKEPGEGASDDAALQATWLRRVKTRPQDFLKAKFAWQAQAQAQGQPAPPP
jgi:Ca-activated chloride channel family protein